jgi:hypothetical protein
MVGTILLIVVVAFLVTLIVVMVVKQLKKKPTPTPTPTPIPTQDLPRYLGFLQNVETAIRNDLSEEDLKHFFDVFEYEINDIYMKMDGFDRDFRALLSKYNIPYPY